MRPSVSDSSDTAANERSAISQVSSRDGVARHPDERRGKSTHQRPEASDEQEHHHSSKRKREALSSPHEVTPWTAAEHRALAAAIYNVGVQHSSPTVLREKMSPTTPEEVTLERIKSHLQKYRAKKEKREQEFFHSYDEWIFNAMSFVESKQKQGDRPTFADLPTDMTNPGILSSGAMAAHLGFQIMMEERASSGVAAEDQDSSLPLPVGNSFPLTTQLQSFLDTSERLIQFPTLTDEEKRSSLGSSLCLVMALFFSMRDQVAETRKRSGAMMSSRSIQRRPRTITNSSLSLPTHSSTDTQGDSSSQSDRATFSKLQHPDNHGDTLSWNHLPHDGRSNVHTQGVSSSQSDRATSSKLQHPDSHGDTLSWNHLPHDGRSNVHASRAAGVSRTSRQAPMKQAAQQRSSTPPFESSLGGGLDYAVFHPPNAQLNSSSSSSGGYHAMRIGGIQARQDLWEEDDDYSLLRDDDGLRRDYDESSS